MLRRSFSPQLVELATFEDDPALFDPSPEWFVAGLRPSLREATKERDEGLGLCSLLEQPEALSRAWRSARQQFVGNRLRRAKPRTSGRDERLRARTAKDTARVSSERATHAV